MSINDVRFDTTDRWMMAVSAVCLTFMLGLTYFVGESIRAEQAQTQLVDHPNLGISGDTTKSDFISSRAKDTL